MILKTCFLLILSVGWEVSGVSYSNVYVQTGPEAAASPVEFMQYGPPSYNYEYPTQKAQYNAAPFTYEFPFGPSYSYRTSCPSGNCVYPEQTIASLAPATSSANILTYSAPVSNLPYVYERNDPAASYSYVLVNQGAEQNLRLSNGEVSRAGYSFYQPEGLVQYVADDNQGLNAIIKNYIPEPVAQTETVYQETVQHDSVQHAEPCHEAKSAALTELVSHEVIHEEHENEHKHHSSHEEHEKVHESPEVIETRHGSHETVEIFLESHEARHGSHESHEVSSHEEHESHEPKHGSHEIHESSHEVHESHEARHGSHEEPEVREIILHSGSHEHHGERIIVIETESENKEEPGTEEHETEHGHIHVETIHEGHEHHAHEEHDHIEEVHEESTHESDSHEHTHEAIIEATHVEHPEGHVAVQVPAPVANNVYISYNDFIKCIQAAMARGNTHPYYSPVPTATATSPLTYLVFNKPC